MNRIVQISIVLIAIALAAPAIADAEKGQHYGAYPPVPLATVLETVSKKTGRIFLTEDGVPSDIVVGQLQAKDLTYSTLLIVLFNNNLAAVTVGDVTNIVDAARVRQHALPIIVEDNDAIDGYEWVTRVVEVRNTNAAQLVPILRPMVPQMGHLVAHTGSNTLVIAARYDNAKRLADIISRIDARATQPSGD